MSAARFMRKRGSFASIFPSVAGPALGGYAGYRVGRQFQNPELGALLGTLTLGTAGKLMGERAQAAEQAHDAMPAGAPYALDPSMGDIPPWALQGARMLRSSKYASHFGSVVGGDLMGAAWPVVEGVRGHVAPHQIAKDVAGQGLGTLAGGFAGHAVGGLIDKAVGHQVPGVLGIPLSTLLAGLGATIGNVKGTEFMRR